MKKLSVCILFGGMSPEHEVSLRSAESVLNNIDKEKYNIFPVGIAKDGDWILFGGKDYSMLPKGTYRHAIILSSYCPSHSYSHKNLVAVIQAYLPYIPW